MVLDISLLFSYCFRPFESIDKILKICLYSTRTPGGPGNSKKRLNKEDTDDDLTRDMEDPLPETNIQEVQLSKQCKASLC